MKTRAQGFTLIELMIAVAIVAILLSVAFPAYQDQVRKSNRSKAQAYLINAASRQQQRFLDVRSYAATEAALGVTAPSDVSNHYTVTFTLVAGPPPTFTLSAAPSSSQAKDKCGTLAITQANVKSPAGCW